MDYATRDGFDPDLRCLDIPAALPFPNLARLGDAWKADHRIIHVEKECACRTGCQFSDEFSPKHVATNTAY
jgi:hypothetical protein